MVAQTQLPEGSLKINSGGAKGSMQGAMQGDKQEFRVQSGGFLPNQGGGGRGRGCGNPIGQGTVWALWY